MVMTGWIVELERALLSEFETISDLGAAGALKQHKTARISQAELFWSVGKNGEITDILLAKKFIQNFELVYYANSKAMKGSIEASLTELAACERMLTKVQQPSIYKDVNDDHSLPRNRVGGLPRDEARQFFKSHWARLLNQDKSRLDRLDKDIIDARRANIRTAEKHYIALQQIALGITPEPPDKSRGAGMGI